MAQVINENAAGLIEFLTRVFDAKEISRSSGADGRVLHAEMKIGASTVMIGEASEKGPAMPATIVVYVDDVDAAYKRALEAGAITLRQPADQLYGDRLGGVKDLAGNYWWIATHIEDVLPDEFELRAERWMKQQTPTALRAVSGF